MIEKIDHIGIAVADMAEGLKLYRDLCGFKLISMTVLDEQRVKVAKLAVGDVIIELLEPTGPESPVARFLATRGAGIHHLAFKTADLQKTTAHFEKNAVPSPQGLQQGADGAQVVFFHPKQTLGVLIELTDGECGEAHDPQRE
jgi:methylmalonyl-CoA/ethylmalonyl-CoA epimerase